MKILKKLLKIIFDIIIIFFIFIAGIIVYNFIQVKFFEKKYPEFMGYTFFEVTTGSMKDTINISDIIIVKLTDDVHKNDIISYENNSEIITHRIIEENDEKLITKGDANNSKDKEITRNVVIGKVVKILPQFGIWIKVLSDYKILLSIFATIILFGVAISKSDKKKNRRNRHSFSRFIRNVRGMRKNAKKEETKD